MPVAFTYMQNQQVPDQLQKRHNFLKSVVDHNYLVRAQSPPRKIRFGHLPSSSNTLEEQNKNFIEDSLETKAPSPQPVYIKIQDDSQQQQQDLFISYLKYTREDGGRLETIRIKAREKIAQHLIQSLARLQAPNKKGSINGGYQRMFTMLGKTASRIQSSCFGCFHQKHGPGKGYTQKMNMMIRCLQDPDNEQLRERICNSSIDLDHIFQLDEMELVPSVRRAKMELNCTSFLEQITIHLPQTEEPVQQVDTLVPITKRKLPHTSDQILQSSIQFLYKKLNTIPDKFRTEIGQLLPVGTSSHLLANLTRVLNG